MGAPMRERRRLKHSSMHYVRSVLRQVWEHPSNAERRVRAVGRAIGWQIAKRVVRRPILISFGPYRVRCHPDNGSAANVVYFTERFDPAEFSFIERYLRDGDHVVDAGANVGLYSLWCAQFIGPTGRIDAFEAAPKAAARMRDNLDINGLTDVVTLHEVAVSSAAGHVDFYTDFDVSNGLVPDGTAASPRSRTVSVECVSLDDVLPSHGFALGKLDVEGAEALALDGWTRRLSAADPPVLLVELLPNQLEKCGSSIASVVEQLNGLGFGLFRFDPEAGTLVSVADPEQVRGNAIAVHLASVDDVTERLHLGARRTGCDQSVTGSRAPGRGPDRATALLVVTTDARRGAQIEGCRLASELDAAGFDVEVAALSPSGEPTSLDIDSLGSSPLSVPTLRALRRRAADVDVVVAYGSTTLPACAIALAASATPFIYRSIGDPAAWIRNDMHRRRTGLLMRRAAHVVALWPQAAQQIEQLYGVSHDRITSIGNARSPEEFRRPSALERTDARRLFGVPHDARVAGVIGSLAPEKRVDLAIQAVARTEDWHLLIVGDGPERAAVHRLAVSLLGPRAVLAGAIEDMPAAYWALDALVMTSATEGMPGVALEAAMSGVPIVSTDVGAMSWLFDHGIMGSVVDAPSPAAIAQRLDALDAATVHTGVEDRFRWAGVVDRWGLTIEQVAHRHRSTGTQDAGPLG